MDQAFERLNPTFCWLYPEGGRPSLPPDQLVLTLLLQVINIRFKRMLIEQLDYNLLFRWFFGLNPDDPVWHPTTFTNNQGRLLNEQLTARFLELLLASPEVTPLLSSDHFSVDGTLLRAWASRSSLERIDSLNVDLPPPSGGNGFGTASAKGRSEPQEISECCCSPTRPSSPAVTVRHGCSASPAEPERSSVIWATAPWRAATVWCWPVSSPSRWLWRATSSTEDGAFATG